MDFKNSPFELNIDPDQIQLQDTSNNISTVIKASNVVINKDNSLLKAEILTLNITTKDININSKESVKVIKN